MSGYDYRADLKEAHTAIVRAHDEGELSLAAAQLKVCFVASPKKAIPAWRLRTRSAPDSHFLSRILV